MIKSQDNSMTLVKENITYKFIKFGSNTLYLCTYMSSTVGSDPNEIFGKEFNQEEYDKLFGKENKKKMTKKEKLELQRRLEVEKSRKLMGLN